MTATTATATTAPPAFIVMDTNVLMRIFILEYGTGESIGFFGAAETARIFIVLGPMQADEFWRNAPDVFREHFEHWEKLAKKIRSVSDQLLTETRAATALNLCDGRAEEATKQAKTILEMTKNPAGSWQDFEKRAEGALARIVARVAVLNLPSEKDIFEAAKRRELFFNPPCRDGKKRQVGDCTLWETVLALVKMEKEVWFATTDTDFSASNDVHELHPFLQRELRQAKGKLRFFHEDRNLGLVPGGRFRVLDEFFKVIPGRSLEALRRALEFLNVVTPGVSLDRVLDALQKLTFREREILKLRMGLGDTYQYTQEEVGRIFKRSQGWVSRFEKAALERFERALRDLQWTPDPGP